MGYLSDSFFFGWLFYLSGLYLCNYYVLMISFLSALTMGDWMASRNLAIDHCY
jgi:hypothetical protein